MITLSIIDSTDHFVSPPSLLLLMAVGKQVRKFVILTGDTKDRVLCEALDITSHAVRKHLTAMATEGLLRKSSQGRYVLSTRYRTYVFGCLFSDVYHVMLLMMLIVMLVI
jgi:hypothetical protein